MSWAGIGIEATGVVYGPTVNTRMALGLRSGEGGTVAVALRWDGTPELVAARTLRLNTPDVHGQAYHAASADPEHGDEIIAATEAVARRLALEAVNGMASDHGPFDTVGVVLGSGWSPTRQQALTQHAAKHAAEGELYREALAGAGESLGLPVVAVREKDLFSRASETFNLGIDTLNIRLTELGKQVGIKPWRKPHKLGALVAWLAVAPQT
jgi:hypothetical protein